jgi:acyl-CoA thioesterase
MDNSVKKAVSEAVQKEPLARLLKMRLIHLDLGYSRVEMAYDPSMMDNLFCRAHGGAVFALIDEAFETPAQTHGEIAVAMNVNVTYVGSPKQGVRLEAEAREISKTKKTASYEIKVRDHRGELIAVCQALAYRTGKPLPFL